MNEWMSILIFCSTPNRSILALRKFLYRIMAQFLWLSSILNCTRTADALNLRQKNLTSDRRRIDSFVGELNSEIWASLYSASRRSISLFRRRRQTSVSPAAATETSWCRSTLEWCHNEATNSRRASPARGRCQEMIGSCSSGAIHCSLG